MFIDPPTDGNPAIILHFSGGRIGNQLYELSTAIATAIDQGKKLFIPKSYYNNPSLYNVFEVFKVSQELMRKTPPASPISKNVFGISYKCYQPIPYKPCHMSIMGGFQSWRYFHHIRDRIIQSVQFSEDIVKKMGAKYLNNNTKPKLSVHVRRGDYKDTSWQKIVYLLNDDNYYQKALKDFPSDTPILLFSDELNEAKKLKSLQRFTNITPIDEGPIESLYLMSQCANHIIANSTFSWWGAYLSKNGNEKTCGKVICPEKWFKTIEGITPFSSDHVLPFWKEV